MEAPKIRSAVGSIAELVLLVGDDDSLWITRKQDYDSRGNVTGKAYRIADDDGSGFYVLGYGYEPPKRN